MARIQVIHETTLDDDFKEWRLFLQWGRYIYDDGTSECGYRFIYRKPGNRHLQAARGGARIPDIETARKLLGQAETEGWGELSG